MKAFTFRTLGGWMLIALVVTLWFGFQPPSGYAQGATATPTLPTCAQDTNDNARIDIGDIVVIANDQSCRVYLPLVVVHWSSTTPSTPTVVPATGTPATATPTPVSGDITLTGRVYDAASGPEAPLADATVAVTVCVPRSFPDTSDSTGHYEILLPASYVDGCATVTLTATKNGYSPFTATVDVAALRSNPVYDFGLTPAGSPTPTPSAVVTGSVELANGSCCMGGIAGEGLAIPAAFTATSSLGTVTEMRVSPLAAFNCSVIPDMSSYPWEPFAASQSYSITVAINWVGYALHVQYRDDQGNLSPILCDEVDVEGMPASPTPTPSTVVTGSVVIEEGRCCVGGIAGQSLAIDTAFGASSTAGAVTEMRVYPRYGGGCASVSEMEGRSWEAFAPTQSHTVTVGINWIGYYVSAQYRDDQGNLSPILCDDISVEGMPAPPSPTPNLTVTPTPAMRGAALFLPVRLRAAR